MSSTLTARQAREREYFDEWIRRQQVNEVKFESVEGKETRPWNPYWYLAQVIRGLYVSPAQRLLDFGCGYGYYSLMFARVGYEVFGFDVSANNIVTAKNLAHKYTMVERTHFDEGTAETIRYPADYFDIVAGVDILHHVDIEPSLRECYRVLKPGGVAIFKEPIEVPVFDTLRNSRMGTRICTKERSFEHCLTDDERKLTAADVKKMAGILSVVETRRFRLFSRFDALWHHVSVTRTQLDMLRKLERFDEACFKLLPFLQPFGGEIVITLKKV